MLARSATATVALALWALLLSTCCGSLPNAHLAPRSDEQSYIHTSPSVLFSSRLVPRNASSSVLNSTLASSGNETLQDALEIVKAAQAEARARNSRLLASPRVNVYSLREGQNKDNSAPILQKNGTLNVSVSDGTGVNGTVSVAAATIAQVEARNQSLADPQTTDSTQVQRRAGGFWMENMVQNGASPLAPTGYKVWRNVKDYGAKGDGTTDDTAAINRAISDGNRCGADCGSTSTLQAVVYFPSGTYLVSRSLISYYFTQMIGDPTNKPVIKVASSFVGLGVISSDVYIDGGNGAEWYINQSNFYRQVRNFIIDMTAAPANDYIAGIHWQVAQATSLQNIFFKMSTSPGNNQQGIFMENGSGGLMSDLTFIGGSLGAYVGNQQFTVRNLLFLSQLTRALEIHWDWGWTWKGIGIGNCPVGVVMSGPDPNALGSAIFLDSSFQNTPTALKLSAPSSSAYGKITLNLFNVRFTNVGAGVAFNDGRVLLDGGSSKTVKAWGLGKRYGTRNGESAGTWQGGADYTDMPEIDASLMISDRFFERSKPQYEALPAGQFVNIKLAPYNAVGDGKWDDTSVLNRALQDTASAGQILWVPAGIYLVRDTITIPSGAKVVGQAWSQIMGTGAKFSNILAPYPVVRVGKPGDVGSVEIQDLLFTVKGATAGAIILQWNILQSGKGTAAMWDTHIRVGGAAGSDLQAGNCPRLTGRVNPNCIAASLLVHITSSASAYFENTWFWVADHDLDTVAQTQIDVYVGRGVLVESTGPVWLYGTASEHCVLYQYQTVNAGNIFMGMIQTESPYYQTTPEAPKPFSGQPGFPQDPDFSYCAASSASCAFSWAVRIINSSNMYIYGAGLYSWFQKYGQDCVQTENCQDRIFQIKDSSSVWIYSLITKAAVEMISPDGGVAVLGKDNKINYCDIVMAWMGSAGSGGPSSGGAIHRSPASATIIPFPATTVGPTATFTLSGPVVSQVDYTPNNGNQNAPPGPGASVCQRCDLSRLLTSTCCGVDGGVSNPVEIGPGVPLPRSLILPRGFVPNQPVNDQSGMSYQAGEPLPREIIVPIGTIFTFPFIIPRGLPLSNAWSPDASQGNQDNCTMYIASDFWSGPLTISTADACLLVLPPMTITTTTWTPPVLTLSTDELTTTTKPPPYTTELVRVSKVTAHGTKPSEVIKPIPGPKPLCFRPKIFGFSIQLCPPPPLILFPPDIPPITIIPVPPGTRPGPINPENKPSEDQEQEEDEEDDDEEQMTCSALDSDEDPEDADGGAYDGSDSYPGAGSDHQPDGYTAPGAGIGNPRTTTATATTRVTMTETRTITQDETTTVVIAPPPTPTEPPKPPRSEPTARHPNGKQADVSCTFPIGFPRHDDIADKACRAFCEANSGRYLSNLRGGVDEWSWAGHNYYENERQSYWVYIRMDLAKGYEWTFDKDFCMKTLGVVQGCLLGGKGKSDGQTWTITYNTNGSGGPVGGPGPKPPNDPR